uniref:Uncharacterized protein n=1 Tax=Anguilla anguilla TaxID=7936 RepID=A0A0E9WQE3_ANGAN
MHTSSYSPYDRHNVSSQLDITCIICTDTFDALFGKCTQPDSVFCQQSFKGREKTQRMSSGLDS